MNPVRSSLLITRKQACNYRQMCERYVHRTQRTLLSSDEKSTEKNETEEDTSIDDTSEPTNCCMSGCANCVWIQYAEKLSSTLEKSDADVQKLILEKIQDPNMKAFLSMELRCRNIIK